MRQHYRPKNLSRPSALDFLMFNVCLFIVVTSTERCDISSGLKFVLVRPRSIVIKTMLNENTLAFVSRMGSRINSCDSSITGYNSTDIMRTRTRTRT